jgi:hypothetical protein
LLANYKNDGNQNKRSAATAGGLDQVAFLIEGKRTKTDGSMVSYPHIKCFKCKEFGDYKSDCPKKKKQTEGLESEKTSLVTVHVTLAVMKNHIDPMWILYNNESTVDVFKNRDILTNIRKTKNKKD